MAITAAVLGLDRVDASFARWDYRAVVEEHDYGR